MATEMSAFCAIIAPDEQVFAALEGRPFAPHGAAWDAAVAQWRGLASRPDARFDREVTVDAAEVAPMISWGTSPQQAVPITGAVPSARSEEHTSELQSLMRISYAVFCLKKKR